MDVTDCHVLVTGASRGLGEAIADAFGAAGSRLTLVARDSDRLALVASRVGGHPLAADLADPQLSSDLIARAEGVSGPVDVLINNAAVGTPAAFQDYSATDLEHAFRVNLLAPVELCHQVLPGMLSRARGRIVNISSGAAYAPLPGSTPYCACKAGLSQLTATLRAELQGTPVGTTLVELGPTVPSAMLDEVMSPGSYAPTRAAFQLLYRLRLFVDTPRERVAAAVVRATREQKAMVRFPTRLSPMLAVAGLPRELALLLLRWDARRA